MGFPFQNPQITLKSPLDDKVQLMNLKGAEALSNLFSFSLTLISDDHNLDFSAMVGEPVTVAMKLAQGESRYISGTCTHFSHAGPGEKGALYHARLRPWLWQLTLASDCRIYQNKTTPEILEALFKDLGFSDYSNKLTNSYEKREFCVQYMETCFNFVSRLMEEEGIYYFFTFEDGKHTMVLADDLSVHQPCEGGDALSFQPDNNISSRYNTVPHCVFGQAMTSGGLALNDFNFEAPKEKLLVEESGEGSEMKHYYYPGSYGEKGKGEQKAKRFQEAHEQSARELSGGSFAPALAAGGKFSMASHPRDALNRGYILKTVNHRIHGEQYSNAFTAFPDDKPFRPQRETRKARIYGSQTAIVAGKNGEEIWTDKYGRIKIQFHWDREGKNDENSSCWVRVAHSQAGKNWGAFFLPRIGQEVIVNFLDGDPDRPVVSGCVYNAESATPCNLPDDQTQTVWKSNSSKGGDGFNEIRFEDKKDNELSSIQAQKDMNIKVLNDQTREITQNRATTISEGNDAYKLEKGDRTLEILKGKETHKVKDTRLIEIGGDETRQNEGAFAQQVKGNYTLKVDGDIILEAKGKITLKATGDMKIESSAGVDIKAGANLKAEAGANLDAKAGANLKNEAGANLDNKAGAMINHKASASQTIDGGGMVVVKGGMVKIN